MPGVGVLLTVVDEEELLRGVEREEPCHERDHRRMDAAAQALVQLDDFGQHVERHDAEEHASGEAEHEVKARPSLQG